MKSQKLSTFKESQGAWEFPLRFLKGVGEVLEKIFQKDDIRSLWDLLLFLPKRFEDRTKFWTYAEILRELHVTPLVMGRARIISHQKKMGGKGGRKWIEMSAILEEDPSKRILFTFFNDFGGTLARRFPEDSEVIYRGKVQSFRGDLQCVHPEMEKSEKELAAWEKGWVPVYREISGLSSRVIRKIIAGALQRKEFTEMPEGLPTAIVKKYQMPTLKESLQELHFPTQWEPRRENELKPEGRFYQRVAFEELFMMALALHMRRAEWRTALSKAKVLIPLIPKKETWLAEKIKDLPFQLTGDQMTVLTEVIEDFTLKQDPVPMHRLVQGDVGSGKTIVAFLAGLALIEKGFQVALMAPTEILADQHFQNFQKIFPQLKDSCLLLKGALKAKDKSAARIKIGEGSAKFIIGTQALLTDDTKFQNLGLVIVDEQHRFGVEQRISVGDSKLRPHLLVMTATPIPRSLALTLYGDLNLSLIREKPKGRLPIATHVVKEKVRPKLIERLKVFLKEGRQIYIVYPLVEDSEELDLRSAQETFKEWTQHFSPDFAVDILHGKMKSKEKEAAMARFKEAKTKVLVSTTVIEVGVDVPNASVIVIEHAERFGLSQLHQLRGRVGRGSEKSYCILLPSERVGENSEERLKVMESSDDGFFIAERDLEIRGPGEFLGRRQSGLAGFRVAHILRDLKLMEIAREEARAILAKDPQLKLPEHQDLRKSITHWWQGRMELTLAG